MKSVFGFVLFLTVAVQSGNTYRVIEATIIIDLGLQAQLKNTTEFVSDYFAFVNLLLLPLDVGVKISGIHNETKTRLITVRDKNNASIGVSMVRTEKILNQEFKKGDLDENFWDLRRGQEFVTSEIKDLHMKISESDVIISLTALGFCQDATLRENPMTMCTKLMKDVAGRAYLGGACTVTKNLAIVTVHGYHSLFFAAHEIGHLLGIDHDDSRHENIMYPTSVGIGNALRRGWPINQMWTRKSKVEYITQNLTAGHLCLQSSSEIFHPTRKVWNEWNSYFIGMSKWMIALLAVIMVLIIGCCLGWSCFCAKMGDKIQGDDRIRERYIILL